MREAQAAGSLRVDFTPLTSIGCSGSTPRPSASAATGGAGH
jgi:hypothetical protein